MKEPEVLHFLFRVIYERIRRTKYFIESNHWQIKTYYERNLGLQWIKLDVRILFILCNYFKN